MKNFNSSQKGKQGELMALEYLRKKGYQILATNYKAMGAEVDIIAQDKDELVMVEVKSCSSGYEDIGEKITTQKRQKIERAAQYFLAKKHLQEVPIRFEVVAVLLSQGVVEHFREEFFDF
jgi:putative endonuclease